LWHTTSIRCGAEVQTLLEVKRTCRDRRPRIDSTRLTPTGHRAQAARRHLACGIECVIGAIEVQAATDIDGVDARLHKCRAAASISRLRAATSVVK